ELVPPVEDTRERESAACTALRADLRRLEAEHSGLEQRRNALNPRNPDTREELDSILRLMSEKERQIADAKKNLENSACNQSGRPARGYSHPWKFLPEPVFQLADRFSHFGVYDLVDSRTQFYTVTPAAGALQKLVDGQSGAWINDPQSIEDAKRIKIRGYSFRFDWARLPWPGVGDPGWGFEALQSLFAGVTALLIGKLWPSFLDLLSTADRDDVPSIPPVPQEDKTPPSLYNPDTRLRIVKRGSQWIAMHWDKRDDDLMAFNLGTWVQLKSRIGPELNLDGAGGQIEVKLNEHRWVEQPPAARTAYFNWAPAGPAGETRAMVGFVTGRPQIGLSNIWRVRMAAFAPGGGGQTVNLLDVITIPDANAPPNFTPKFDGWFHEHVFTPNAAQLANLRQYCSSAGALTYGTSIWLEDVVGHVSVPEEVLWLRTPQPMDLVVDRDIIVPESLALVDTGIEIGAGDDYALEARGMIRPHALMSENNPRGLPTVSHEPKFPLNYGDDAFPFSLIAQFGRRSGAQIVAHPWFYVGTGRPRERFACTDPHRLYLRTNDDTPGGGSGQFTCRVKVWRPRATAAVVISRLVANPVGRDVEPGAGEHVILQNTGSATENVGGWFLTDAAGHRMVISADYTIPPGGTLTVFTGLGTNSPSRFYCQRRAAVLNNTGDTIVLHSA
ncbi:MAG TPA: lamin tail domain-containing protein, partial [Vicinamibacterales bacterium]|nr:lamin tail domain-containing protein [Vicinamibacterales bacterium]